MLIALISWFTTVSQEWFNQLLIRTSVSLKAANDSKLIMVWWLEVLISSCWFLSNDSRSWYTLSLTPKIEIRFFFNNSLFFRCLVAASIPFFNYIICFSFSFRWGEHLTVVERIFASAHEFSTCFTVLNIKTMLSIWDFSNFSCSLNISQSILVWFICSM